MMSRLSEIPARLYRGEVSINFVGRRRTWYTISGLILLVGIIALATRGLNFSVEFKGGSILQFSAPGATLAQLHNAVANSPAGTAAIIQHVGTGTDWQITSAKLDFAQLSQVEHAILTSGIHVPNGISGFSPSVVSATWGGEITAKALEALIVFLVVIVIYLSIAFEWKMATAAFVALIHDIVITVGVYSLFGFTVSPASVIGLLTILGYSLYDTVVVFDKVRENTAGLLGSGRSTYSQAANLALNQTLVRSINTSIIALLPVAAILFIGSAVLGPGELQDLALVLFVGMLSGTYSSICIATPVLADLKEREHQYQALAKRVALREAGGRSARRQAAKAAKAPAEGTVVAAGPKSVVPGDPAPGGAGPGRRVSGRTGPGGTVSGSTVPGGTVPGGAGPGGTVSGTGPGGTVSGSTVRATGPVTAGQDAGDAEDDYADEPAGPPAEEDAAAQASASDRVPAGQGSSRATPASGGVRPGPRQQPRRTTAAGRRPGGKKKKR
jgi:preprotein translocase subunit SecF